MAVGHGVCDIYNDWLNLFELNYLEIESILNPFTDELTKQALLMALTFCNHFNLNSCCFDA